MIFVFWYLRFQINTGKYLEMNYFCVRTGKVNM